jgi:hypothetical protein
MPPKDEPDAFMNAPMKNMFNGENPALFGMWMFQLEAHLRQRKLFGEELTAAQESQLFNILVLSTEGTALQCLMEVEDKIGSTALKKLNSTFAAKTQDRMGSIQEELFERYWRNDDTVDKFASDIRSLRRQLALIGKHAVIPNAAIRSLVISKISKIQIFVTTAAHAPTEQTKMPSMPFMAQNSTPSSTR